MVRCIFVDGDAGRVDAVKKVLGELGGATCVREYGSIEAASDPIMTDEADLVFIADDPAREGAASALGEALSLRRNGPFIIYLGADAKGAPKGPASGGIRLARPYGRQRLGDIMAVVETIARRRAAAAERGRLAGGGAPAQRAGAEAGAGHREAERVSLLRRGYIASHDKSKYVLHRLSDVAYFTVEERSVFMRTAAGSYRMPQTMGSLERMLGGSGFIRCHKSFLVNLSHIESVDVWFNQTFLINIKGTKERIPVGGTYYKSFKDIISTDG